MKKYVILNDSEGFHRSSEWKIRVILRFIQDDIGAAAGGNFVTEPVCSLGQRPAR